MDEVTKYRLTGAAFWLGLLIIFVPSWYSNPVEEVMEKLGMSKIEVVEDDLVLDQEALESLQKQPIKSQAKLQNQQTSQATTPTYGQKTPVALPPKLEVAPEVVETPPQVGVVKLDEPRWYIQVATLSSQERANAILVELEGNYQVTIRDFSAQGAKRYAVRIGPFSSELAAKNAQAGLEAKYKDSLIISNP